MTAMMQDSMKQMNQKGMDSFNQMRHAMGQMPGMNSTAAFGDMYNGYNKWHSMMNDAAAPFTKLMPPTQQSKQAAEWSEIANRIAQYNIKNAELQYMIYAQGTKVMDKLAENVAAKVQEGKEVGSLVGLYQEWLNMSDKVYVSLFESDEYSKLMAEVGGMQMKLRKDIETHMEKAMTDLPVVTKSAMDEVYKSIYDLKAQVRQLEKMLDVEAGEEITEEKTTKRTKKA
jgi:polyhydroxyalkanoate synthesis regulator phasin